MWKLKSEIIDVRYRDDEQKHWLTANCLHFKLRRNFVRNIQHTWTWNVIMLLWLQIRHPHKTTMDSRVAQWERAGLITQRSMDRNHSLLCTFFFRSILFTCWLRNSLANFFYSVLIFFSILPKREVSPTGHESV